jgi:hypothetical protein
MGRLARVAPTVYASPTLTLMPIGALVFDKPRALLHLEGAVIFLLSIYVFHRIHPGWLLFIALLLVPDLSMLGYLLGVRIGAVCYNVAHTLALPLIAAGAALASDHKVWLPFLAIWIAHIGMDRMLGYGLKYPTAFKDTHLQRV